MKVSWVVLIEAVACSMVARYERVALVLVLAKASGAWVHGLLDLEILATHKFSLISLISSRKCQISKGKIKESICTSLQ
jgi:dethiobiotin synthetase